MITNTNDHIGRRLLRLKIKSGLYPIEAVVNADVDHESLIRDFEIEVRRAAAKIFGRDISQNIKVKLEQEYIVLSPEQRKKKWEDWWKALKENAVLVPEEPPLSKEHNPGYYLVQGIRHQAIVQATSEEQAREKTKDTVGDWEYSSISFLGKEFDSYSF